MIHNALQRFTELQRAAKVACGLDAGAGGLERMSETLQLVKDFWRYPEDAYLRGERRCSGTTALAAGGAGNLSAVSLRILQTSWMMVVERVEFSVSAACTIEINSGQALANTRTTKGFLDSRAPGTPLAVLQDKNADAINPGTYKLASYRMGGAGIVQVPVDYIAFAGTTETGICVVNTTANLDLRVSIWWRERVQLPGELFR